MAPQESEPARHAAAATVELARVVRFCVDLRRSPCEHEGSPAKHNPFAGWPAMRGIGAYYELEVRCRGVADARTGYMMNISEIDAAVRQHGLPIISAAVRDRPDADPATILPQVLAAIAPSLGNRVTSLRWRLTPYYSVAMSAASTDRVSISQQFEFAAAHRLDCPDLSPEQNRRVFGRCNNPNGHGHNYRIEVVVSAPLAAPAADPRHPPDSPFTIADLERIVHETVIQRFDHKHLNLDTAEFAGLNPSVEHIARVCHGLLAGPIRSAAADLQRVTVWETEKTSCTYPA